MEKLKNRLISYLIIIFCLLICSCAKSDQTENSEHNRDEKGPCWNEYSLTNVRMTGKGNNSNDYKVSFRPSEKTDGVKAYLVGYSRKTIKEVRDYLQNLSASDLYALDKPTNRAYVITDISYADGVGNTLNSNQNDIVTGEDISVPGTYYFYACTIGDNGLLGIEQATENFVQEPYAGQLKLKVEHASVSGSFKSYKSNSIEKNIVFYSKNGYVLVKKELEKYSGEQLLKLIQDGEALGFDNAMDNTVQFTADQLKDVDGKEYNKNNLYYIYVASIGKNGLVGLSYCDDTFLTPETAPAALKSIGNGKGKGYIFPNGGAATIGSSRDSIISKSQSMFCSIKGLPRIAILGASSGKESEIYSYFYVDDANADSYTKRFKEAGFEAVYIPLTTSNYEKIGENKYFTALIESCHGVYFTGGDQSKAVRALYRNDGSLNRVGKAIMNVYRKGGIIMGTSAGAHVVSSPCFQDGSSYSVMYRNKAEAFDICKLPGNSQASAKNAGNCIYYKALDLARNAAGDGLIFDSHFNARGRFGRLSLICRDTKTRFGAGLDEATGLAVSKGIGTVFGAGGVTILDTKNAKYGQGKSFDVKGLEVYYLTAGDSFDFSTCTVVPSNDKRKLSDRGKAEEIKDIFAPNYATSKAFLSFLQSGEESKKYQAISDIKDASLPPFEITLRKSKKTVLYQSADSKYTSVNALVNYNKADFCTLMVDITMK